MQKKKINLLPNTVDSEGGSSFLFSLKEEVERAAGLTLIKLAVLK